MGSKVTRAELVEAVRRIIDADGSEEELNSLMDDVSAEVPHPSWTDLIFHSDKDLSAEEVVDEALRYKPIQL